MSVDSLAVKVVGLSFCKDYPNNIFGLAKDGKMVSRKCSLIRERHNQHDTNSIRVDIDDKQFGYLPKLISSVIAKEIDEGAAWRAEIDSLLVSVQNPNQPGLKLFLWRDDANS